MRASWALQRSHPKATTQDGTTTGQPIVSGQSWAKVTPLPKTSGPLVKHHFLERPPAPPWGAVGLTEWRRLGQSFPSTAFPFLDEQDLLGMAMPTDVREDQTK